jgi:sulfur transfer complex TusBCD TusB component (DsrH family)
MRERINTAVAGVLVDGAEEVTEKMVIDDAGDEVFAPVTTELSAFDVGVEATLAALLEDLVARGLLESFAGDVALTVRDKVYGIRSTVTTTKEAT